jgi:hypothetical protein
MSVTECPLCDLPLLSLGSLQVCRSCAYRIGEPPPTFTHSQVAEATAHYVARGGAITRLPDGPARLATDVRLQEQIINGIPSVPWEDLIEPWRNPDFNLILGGRDVSPQVTSAQAAAPVAGAKVGREDGGSEGDIPLELLAATKRGEGG